jgi:uncharacterized membrane-anchored protein
MLTDHPDRYILAAEVHARVAVEAEVPLRASYVALLVATEARAAERAALVALCERFSVAPPAENATHFAARLDQMHLKWERHGEFSGYTCFLNGVQSEIFERPAVEALPDGWLESLPGERIVAAHAALVSGGIGAPSTHELTRHFAGNTVVGAEIGEGVGLAFTDFKIHKDGFSRFLLVDRNMTNDQAGRMVQRLFEIEAYRMLALLALPIARRQSPAVTAIEQAVVKVTTSIADGKSADEALLNELSLRSAEVERAIAESQYRYGASRAYYELVKTRISELRERRISGVQTIEEFMTRRLTPAMATCATVAQRLRDLSERIARTSALLSTRVDIAREKQNQALLASMDRRARLQLRLQQTVEGLSVAAITYYVVGLLGYVFKAFDAADYGLDPAIATGISIPVVVLLVALAVRRAKRKVIGEDAADPRL